MNVFFPWYYQIYFEELLYLFKLLCVMFKHFDNSWFFAKLIQIETCKQLAGSQTDSKSVGENVKCVLEFFFCMGSCLSDNVLEGGKACECVRLLPGGKDFISYLQAQTGGLIVSHFFLTPLCSPTPDGHSSAPYRFDDLQKHCSKVKTPWSLARAEQPSVIAEQSFFPLNQNPFKLP